MLRPLTLNARRGTSRISVSRQVRAIWRSKARPPIDVHVDSHLHCESKKLCHYCFYCNFGKFWPIFKIISLSESEIIST